MIDCKFVLENFWDINDCTDVDQSAIREHLESCSSCKSECDSISAMKQGLKDLPTEPSEDFTANLHRKLQEEGFGDHQVLRPTPSFWKRPLALVAAGVAAVFVFALISRYPATNQVDTADLKLTKESTKVGLLAEREWQESDSIDDASLETERFEDLSPVSVTASP